MVAPGHVDGARVTIIGSVPVEVIDSLVATSGAPPDALTYKPVRAASGQISATAGITIWSIYANSNVNQDRWLLIFDKAVAPVPGDIPDDFVQIPRRNNGEAGVFIPRRVRDFGWWACSTSSDSLVAGGADLLVRARYTTP